MADYPKTTSRFDESLFAVNPEHSDSSNEGRIFGHLQGLRFPIIAVVASIVEALEHQRMGRALDLTIGLVSLLDQALALVTHLRALSVKRDDGSYGQPDSCQLKYPNVDDRHRPLISLNQEHPTATSEIEVLADLHSVCRQLQALIYHVDSDLSNQGYAWCLETMQAAARLADQMGELVDQLEWLDLKLHLYSPDAREAILTSSAH